MKVLIVLLALAALVSSRPEEDHYDSRYDDFDVDEMISNKRLLKSAADCINGKGKCTRDLDYFKQRIPEAIQNSCNKCTDKQKINIAKLIKAVMEQLPEEYKLIYNKHAMIDKEKIDDFIKRFSQ